MTELSWVLFPVIAAAIGWFTNFVAVRMIFRPRNPVSILGIKIQGLLPKRRAEFARSIGETVHEHLFSVDDIKKILDEPEVKVKLDGAVERKIDDFLTHKLAALNPMLGAFLQGPFLGKIRGTLVTEVSGMFGEGVEMLGEHLDDRFDARAIVEAKILEFDMEKLEGIVLAVAKKELVAIEVLGAVLGFLVGLVQMGLLYLLQ